MESMLRLFREQLFSAFYEWLEKNRDYLGKRHDQLYEQSKKSAENLADNEIGIFSMAMWMFNSVANCGVMCGIGPDGPVLYDYSIPEGLDEKTTKRLLLMISSCMNLQHLPPEIAKRKIPIISSEKFSLKLYLDKKDAS